MLRIRLVHGEREMMSPSTLGGDCATDSSYVYDKRTNIIPSKGDKGMTEMCSRHKNNSSHHRRWLTAVVASRRMSWMEIYSLRACGRSGTVGKLPLWRLKVRFRLWIRRVSSKRGKLRTKETRGRAGHWTVCSPSTMLGYTFVV